jgi:hypothetical protein
MGGMINLMANGPEEMTQICGLGVARQIPDENLWASFRE